MADVVPSFPLSRLPPKELNHVLKTMDYMDQIAFSLISKRTKSLIINTPKTPVIINHLEIADDVIFRLCLGEEVNFYWFLNSINVRRTGPPIALTAADTVRIQEKQGKRNKILKWKKSGYQVRDWLQHLLDVSNHPVIERIDVSGDGERRFQVDSVIRELKGLEIVRLMTAWSCSDEYYKSILSGIPTGIVTLRTNPFPSHELLQEVLIQNSRVIHHHPNGFTLNDLLVTNTENVYLDEPIPQTSLFFNRFIKLWRSGIKRRLARICAPLEGSVDRNSLLRGIEHLEVNPRVDKDPRRPKYIWINQGEERLRIYDIRGTTGQKATLYICEDPPGGIEFSVWKDF